MQAVFSWIFAKQQSVPVKRHNQITDELRKKVFRICITFVRIRILPACHFDPDPDPSFHFDADPYPDPSFQIKAQNLEKVLK